MFPGVEMRVEFYNIKLRTWIQNDVEFSAVDFLEEMESKDMQPSKVSYIEALNYCIVQLLFCSSLSGSFQFVLSPFQRTCVLLVEKYSSQGDINGAK